MSGSSTPNASLSRTIVLASPDPLESDILRWPPKSPGTVQDYSLDVTAWAADAQETVTGFVTMVSAPGSTTNPLLAPAQPLVAGSNVCTVQLSGGASPTDCAVTFVIETATRTLTLTCWIVVTSISGVIDRYGGLAVLPTGLDPVIAAQIAALEQQLGAEASARAAADAALQTNIAGATATADDADVLATTVQGSLTTIAATLAGFEQSVGTEITSLQQLIAGLSTGLTLTATGVTPGTYTDGLLTFTVDLYGRLTAASSSTGTIAPPPSNLNYLLEENGLTDFLLEDASGYILVDGSLAPPPSSTPAFLLEEDGVSDLYLEDASGFLLLEASQ